MSTWRRAATLRVGIVSLAAVVCLACSGDDEEGSDAETVVSPTANHTPASTTRSVAGSSAATPASPVASPSPATQTSINDGSSIAGQLFEYINAKRKDRLLEPLARDPALQRAAEEYARSIFGVWGDRSNPCGPECIGAAGSIDALAASFGYDGRFTLWASAGQMTSDRLAERSDDPYSGAPSFTHGGVACVVSELKGPAGTSGVDIVCVKLYGPGDLLNR